MRDIIRISEISKESEIRIKQLPEFSAIKTKVTMKT